MWNPRIPKTTIRQLQLTEIEKNLKAISELNVAASFVVSEKGDLEVVYTIPDGKKSKTFAKRYSMIQYEIAVSDTSQFLCHLKNFNSAQA